MTCFSRNESVQERSSERIGRSVRTSRSPQCADGRMRVWPCWRFRVGASSADRCALL
jgi:hypothetical protein